MSEQSGVGTPTVEERADAARRARISEIRAAAAAQLNHPAKTFDAQALLDELKTLEARDDERREVDFLEAVALLVVCDGRRLRRADKPLYRLYQARIAKGEGDLFEAFKAQLQAAEESGFSLDGVYFPSNFAGLDTDEVLRVVSSRIAEMRELVGEVFANSGTLLGAVRENGLIEHDDDIDLAVILEAESAETAAEAWVTLHETLQRRGLIAEKPLFRMRNPCVFKVTSNADYNIDLFPAWISGGRVFVYPHTSGELTAEQVLPLQISESTGLTIPADPEAMLEINYGPGWRVPDPAFQFRWGRANRRFADFRAAVERVVEDRRAGRSAPAWKEAQADVDAVAAATAHPEAASSRSEVEQLPGMVRIASQKPYRLALTYGTFDLFHIGHSRLLQRISELADRVVVGLSSDEFNHIKGKKCVIPYHEREEILRASRFVSEVFPENSWEQKPDDIRRLGADLFVMGDDWMGKFDDLSAYCDVIYFSRTDGISTTHLKKVLKDWGSKPATSKE